ncbi:hypothetical protein FNO01nite_19920 [Flavobacterium noncentrifugens]|uniref:Por secretion system C-terminal sorting domain-containing protein n=1 Tax=Flavobacterium noncentrifugens TaxID=1128970 RepID=A0A1G8YQK0_9FLAO|nr:T9SS type A sorting domain-containing protein [Flavobacterium noncentrifugens]GEP51320.1 hypothetical protein FNO01nite_19920 [Flavobacterium noncentrifugens]SDK05027.1 Por secretion system C-terminal sorting domain-containing protein [Flavobacterium noncentrifugens]
MKKKITLQIILLAVVATSNIMSAASLKINFYNASDAIRTNAIPNSQSIWPSSINFMTLVEPCTTTAPTGDVAQIFCTGATVSNLTATGTEIKWYAGAIGGTALAPETALANGTIYYASQTVTCESTTRLAVTVTVNTMPSILTTTPGNRCGIGAVLLGATASAGTLSWYNSASGGNSLGTGATFSTGALSETTTFYVSAKNGNCTSERVEVLATVGAPLITGITPGNRCGAGSVTLGATSNTPTLNWYDVSAGGTPIGTGNTFNTPSISISRTYYVQAVDGSCTSLRTTVFAAINAVPNITGADQIICGPSATTLSATATAGTIKWYAAPGGVGSVLATGSQYETAILDQTTTFFAVATNGNCTAETAVTVMVSTTPPAPTGEANQTFCNAQTLHELRVTGENISWYSEASGAGILLDPFTPLVSGTTYYAVQSFGNCESPSLAVTVSLGGCLKTEGFSADAFKLYPNPITDVLYISYKGNISKIEISNLMGQVMKSQTINAPEAKLYFSQLAAGIYLIKVEVENHSEVFKVIKK